MLGRIFGGKWKDDETNKDCDDKDNLLEPSEELGSERGNQLRDCPKT